MLKKSIKWITLSSVLFLLAGFLASCGYTPAPILPDHIKTMAVNTFKNATIEYGIEEKLTLAVSDEFLRDGRLDIAGQQQADALLTGEITQYVLEPVSYDEQDIIEEYKVYIIVDLVFKDLTTDTVLWEERAMEGSVNYFVSSKAGELVETEDEAQDRLVDDLALDIVRRTIEGW